MTYLGLVPAVLADDPLWHHMRLVLQAACDAADAAGRLYAATLADAPEVHILRRVVIGGPLVPAGPGGLTPATLHRVLAYIQSHLDDALRLATLAIGQSTLPEYPGGLIEGDSHVWALAERMAHYAIAIRTAMEQATNVEEADMAHVYTDIARGVEQQQSCLETQLHP